MAIPSTLLLPILLSLLLIHFPSPSAANENNIIVTGDVLQTDSQLTVPNAVFVIQDDCNLVLYNKDRGFVSDTSGFGANCTATLSNYGQLQVRNANGTVIWSSSLTGPKGEYAAILQPDGHVGIYGPKLWTTGPFRSAILHDETVEAEKVDDEPSVPNLLFSSEVLNEKSKLVSRDYALQVTEGCGLEFTKASVGVVWSSQRQSYAGRHCFARLNFHGQLSVVDDSYRIVWQTKPASTDGVYVLVVKINGEAAIYGRRIWSTK